jgi:hypothetical protein
VPGWLEIVVAGCAAPSGLLGLRLELAEHYPVQQGAVLQRGVQWVRALLVLLACA